MSIANDEFLMRLMRVRFDLMAASQATGLDDMTRQVFDAICHLMHRIIEEEVVAIGFETEQAATLHARGIYEGMTTLPVVTKGVSW